LSLRLIRQPETGQRHACQADAEFLERPSPRDRLGQVLGEFIESAIHTFRSFFLAVVAVGKRNCRCAFARYF